MMQMAETQEWGLVKRYAHEGSQAAFRALVDRLQATDEKRVRGGGVSLRQVGADVLDAHQLGGMVAGIRDRARSSAHGAERGDAKDQADRNGRRACDA